MNASRWTVSSLNEMDQEAFTAAIGGIFEQSPWIVRTAWLKRPFSNLDQLFEAMCIVIGESGEEACLALLRAHPDLGARIRMTRESVQEQTGAGLTSLSPREYRYMRTVNRLYREKFRFPFIIAVKGMDKGEIIAAMGRRFRNPVSEERREALRQVERIARFRLEELVLEGDNPMLPPGETE